ncbi:putative non-specific serine/threonine protein kinase [Rosa chinensis]|uniref:Putative non-specific serine/threonine protein kinase n=1 Tax=Rosa chinensis TaxID=74649 RepID=A0A2P6SE17_ROSCH|nr:putative non-specific serine/threonine protein kinase [Rosa chinensis]
MVLLELVRGRRNCLFQSGGTGNDDTDGNERCFNPISSEERMVYFPQLALQMHKKMRYMELADPRLEGRVRSEEVEKLVKGSLVLCACRANTEAKYDQCGFYVGRQITYS